MVKLLLSVACMLASLASMAQVQYLGFDTVKTMHWNIYNYSGTIRPANPTRNFAIRRVLQYAKPDIFTVNEMQAPSGPDTILNKCLNAFGETRYRQAAWMTEGGGDSYSHLFYNGTKFRLLAQWGLTSLPRGIAVYRLLYLPSIANGSTDSAIILYYSLHPKASNTPSDAATRLETANILLSDARQQPFSNRNMIIQGDLNLYSNTESSYLAYVNASQFGSFRDPLRGDFTSQLVLTQSPRNTQFDGGVNGGLDDRFDFILVQPDMLLDSTRVHLVPNSYKAVGNDGNARGGAVVMSGNRAYPDSVASGVYYGSDHLPVLSKLAIGRRTITSISGTTQSDEFLRMNQLNPSVIQIMPQGCHCSGLVEIFNSSGQTVSQIIVPAGNSEVAIPLLPVGLYFIRASEGEKQAIQRFFITQ